MNSKPFIISIAAVSGGGKTTVARHLRESLKNAEALYFDDYDFPKQPDDICEWVENGADPNAWDLSPMLDDLDELIAKHSKPLDYIILDYPFAYTHPAFAGRIDFAVFIDTPLDVALARRILRDYAQSSADDIRNHLQHYLNRSRDAFLYST